MNTFTMRVHGAASSEEISDVISFVGEDATGSFGLLPGHVRFMTSLVFGLARFTTADDVVHYIAVPGAILYFKDNILTLNARTFLIGEDYDRIALELSEALAREEEALAVLKHNLRSIEANVMRRLMELEARA
ncbi:MAG: F0F1 ATP synthase subunit epsilon [Pseudomonadales bacterium]|nr:F0F1 ATP synthase subunit epsilon [Pseudomonadales bacterium]